MSGSSDYRYPISENSSLPLLLSRVEKLSTSKDPIPLTGWVQGRRASDLEERFARALIQAGLSFTFQEQVTLAGMIPGQEKRVDFMVLCGMPCPVEIDGPIAHQTAGQKGADLVREILLNHAFLRRGIQQIRRVKWWRLESQQMANRQVREMFGGNQ
jgi:hypothetical protein